MEVATTSASAAPIANIANIANIAMSIARLRERENTVLVAIDGMCGSGKSTLGEQLRCEFDGNLFHTDDFFLPPTHIRFGSKEVGGNVDYERFDREILTNLKLGIAFTFDRYDCKSGELLPISVTPKQVNIIEGAYSMHPYFGDIYDLSVLLLIDECEQKMRILNRNGQQMLSRFVEVWIPLENEYIMQTNLKTRCDITLSKGCE